MSASLFLTQELARAKAYNGAEPCSAEAFWQGCPCDDCRATDQALKAEAVERKADNEFFEMLNTYEDWEGKTPTPSETRFM